MTCIFAQTAIWFLSLIQFQRGIDSASRPGRGNRLTLPSGAAPEPSIDGTRLNDWSLLVNIDLQFSVLLPLTSVLRLAAL
jgi:hypothetical protein